MAQPIDLAAVAEITSKNIFTCNRSSQIPTGFTIKSDQWLFVNDTGLIYKGDGVTQWPAHTPLNGASQADKLKYVYASDYGFAVGALGIVNSTALQNAMDDVAASAVSSIVVIPQGSFFTRRGIIQRDNTYVKGEGKYRTIITNIDNTSYANNVGWFFGTYGPVGSTSGTPYQDTNPFAFNPAVRGDTYLTMTVAGQESNFAIGDLVQIQGSTSTAFTINLPNEIAYINSVDATNHRLYLDSAILSNYPAGANTQYVKKLNQGNPAMTVFTANNPSETAFVAQNGSLSDLTIKQLQPGYAALTIAGINFRVDNVELNGYACIQGDPTARSLFTNVTGKFTGGAVELAYMSHANNFKRCDFTRILPEYTPSTSTGIWINSGEGGKYCNFEDVNILDIRGASSASTIHSVWLTGEGNTWEKGSITSSTGADAAINLSSSRSVIRDTTISCKTGHGILVGGSEQHIAGNKIIGTPSGVYGVQLVSGTSNSVVERNSIGGTVKQSQDIVHDLGTGNVLRDNWGF